MLLVYLNLLIKQSSIIVFPRFHLLKNSKGLFSNSGCFIFMCQSSFESFIALFDNLLLQIRQSRQGALQPRVEINLYFKYNSFIILACQESSCSISNFDFKLCIFKQVFIVFLYCIYQSKEHFLYYLMVIISIILKEIMFFSER